MKKQAEYYVHPFESRWIYKIYNGNIYIMNLRNNPPDNKWARLTKDSYIIKVKEIRTFTPLSKEDLFLLML